MEWCGRMNRKNWEQWETEFLGASIDILGARGCAKALSRTFKSVWAKAQKMQILTGDKRWWGKEQERFLKDNFGVMSTEDIASELGVGVSAVYHKAQRIGLEHSRWWTDEDLDFLEEHYTRLSSREIGDALGRTDTSVQDAARKRGLAAKNYYPEDRFCVDCGKKLANKYMKPVRCSGCASRNLAGENNSQWKGGVSSLYKIIQRNLWSVWKKPILERDEFKCGVCGSKKQLEVHHLRYLVGIRDEVIAENPDLDIVDYDSRAKLAAIIVGRHTLQDGTTLCHSCHITYHVEKRGELLGSPNGSAEGNQQPSRSNVINFVDRKVQRLTGEDFTANKPDTSAPRALPKSVMI